VIHFECSGMGWQHHLSCDWGRCRRLIEVLEDQLASRQIDFYENGNVLTYDRVHSRDEFGMLIACRFSKKDKWQKSFKGVHVMTPLEFEKEWSRSNNTIATTHAKQG
jgi:hypothetical protein